MSEGVAVDKARVLRAAPGGGGKKPLAIRRQAII
jgi:hypothetical protein